MTGESFLGGVTHDYYTGIPNAVDGFALDMVCSSGMMSLMTAAAFIKAGEAELALCGGVESMSGAGGFLSSRARWGYGLLPGGGEPLVDIMLRDGLTDPKPTDSGELLHADDLNGHFSEGTDE